MRSTISVRPIAVPGALLLFLVFGLWSPRAQAQTWGIQTQFFGTAFGNPQSMSSGPTVVDGVKATVNAYDALGVPLSFSLFPDTGNPATSLTPLTALMDWNPLQDLLWARFPNLAELQNTWVEGNLTQAQVKAPAAAGGTVLRQTDLTYDTRGRMHRAVDLVGTVAELKFDKGRLPPSGQDDIRFRHRWASDHTVSLRSESWNSLRLFLMIPRGVATIAIR